MGKIIPIMLTRTKILSKVSEDEIMNRYFPMKFDLFKKIRNPFRDDKKADCTFSYNSCNILMFNDYAQPKYSGDCFHICGIANNLDMDDKINFMKVLKIIDRDFNLNLQPTSWNTKQTIQNTHTLFNGKRPLSRIRTLFDEVEIKITPFKADIFPSMYPDDYDFWGQYMISKKTLDHFEVKKVDRAYMGEKDSLVIWESSKKDPIYRYKTKLRSQYQFYRPNAEDKGNRFRTNVKEFVFLGEEFLPETHEVLFITSSYKDILELYEIGIPAIAPIGEGRRIPPSEIQNLLRRFDKIIVNYDNDAAGRIAASILMEEHPIDIETVTVPVSKNVKDISDYVKRFGLKAGKKLLDKYIYNVCLF